MDELELVRRVLAGDTSAFYALVRQHERSLYWVVFGLTGNSADAEEITQEAFLKCYQKLGQFRGEAKFGTWLTQIAINEARMRRRKARPELHESLDEPEASESSHWQPRDLADWRPDPEEQFAEEELRQVVQAAIASLPPAYRVVVVMRDLQQMSNEEVAQALGLSLPATKSRLLRARLQLRDKLAPHFRHREQERPSWWRRLVRLATRGGR